MLYDVGFIRRLKMPSRLSQASDGDGIVMKYADVMVMEHYRQVTTVGYSHRERVIGLVCHGITQDIITIGWLNIRMNWFIEKHR